MTFFHYIAEHYIFTGETSETMSGYALVFPEDTASFPCLSNHQRTAAALAQ